MGTNHISELKEEFVKLFESTLAFTFSDQIHQFKSTCKISKAIRNLLLKNEQQAINQIEKDTRIIQELYDEEYYGHLEKTNNIELSGKQVFEQIINELTVGNRSSTVFHIHAIFIHRIYDSLSDKITDDIDNKKQRLCQKLFYNSLFEDRGRIEFNKNPPKTMALGINRSRFFQNRFRVKSETHVPAMYRFIPDKNSSSFKAIAARGPFIAGPSGHLGSLILGAKLYGNLATEELKEYIFLCALYLINGGNHSFFECRIVADLLEKETENYVDAIPAAILATKKYQKLVADFPQYLSTCR